MALPIQDEMRELLKGTVKSPQLILEIEGLPLLSSTPVGTYPNYDEGLFYDDGLLYDGIAIDESILPYIDLNKSTNQITQQMLIDKGGYSSVTSFDVSLVDKSQTITKLVTPGNTIEEILSKKARLYLSLEGLGHPKESILFFSGIVAGISSGAGYVNINLASPEKLKSQELFIKISAILSAGINNSQTTINVDTTNNFQVYSDLGTLRTYIKIEDEIIEYTTKNSTQFLGCIRGQYNTTAVAHSINIGVESCYRLVGNLRDLSLKLMLSGKNEAYLSDEPIIAFNNYGLDTVANAIFVSKYNFDQYYGTVAGDLITISGATNAGNNGSTTVDSIVSTDLGSYLVLNKTLISEGSGAVFSLTSKYAVLPVGLQMTPDQVDVAEFESKYLQFSPGFFDYDFFITESVNGNEFINTQILYPSNCYALPRKAKTSLGMTIPPLAQYEVKTINETNVTNASSLKINRSISTNFFNAVVIKYDKSATTDKYLRGKITQSAASTNRIKVANKALQLTADGVRQESGFSNKFDTISRRFLDRYKFSAESISVDVQYGAGFTIELGDTVILEGESLQITDIKDGNASRSFRPRLFEVQNKTLNLKGTPINLKLVDTAFSLNSKYGVISPSSVLDSGSTTTNLKLKRSYGTLLRSTSENFKWSAIVGYKIKVFSSDYSFSEETKILSLDPGNANGLIVDPPLSVSPSENYIISIVNYPANIDPNDQALPKALYVYFNNSALVVSGISNSSFTVSALDANDIKVGYSIRIHNSDYSIYSGEVFVTDVTGVTITVGSTLGFTPALNQRIEIMGFLDGGNGFSWL